MEGRKKMEEFYRKLKVGMKLKCAFTTVIVTFAVAMVVSLVSIVMMNVDTYKFYREAYANSTLQMEIRKDIQLVGKYILWSMTTDDTGSTQSYLNSAQKYADQVGKNVTTLVKIMMETAGFEMHDLGRDVPAEEFVNQAEALKAQLVCISTLMTTTMSGMEEIIKLLKERGIRDNVKVMVGGSPVSKKYADDIGADGYSVNAVEAVRVAKELVDIA